MLLDQLDLLFLRLAIRLDEFLNNHVASSNSDDQFTIHNLSIDLFGSKDVVTTSNLLDRNITLTKLQILVQKCVHVISCLGHKPLLLHIPEPLALPVSKDSLKLRDDLVPINDLSI